ncbi:tRNA(Glu)-specific nuclease WapA precursor [Pirellula sp. SH-Sr6A]|uniref:RHS repeat domain-containing protein n=1 Tax=Pirellula sp. SH-Sr6A TaxID=1632865 RepID=UPI00078CF3BD|nr:tRNA(Glu)-specific nuclease WapA precursor [Pirellula sp. SH-Sr6A]
MHARSARRAVEDDIPDSKRCNRNCDPLQSMSMHTQNATVERDHELRSPHSRTGEPAAAFGCTEATIASWQYFHVHSINASSGPSPAEATTATWHHQGNQQYSVTAITTSTGAVAERYAYSAYGEPTILDASGTVLSSSLINNRYTFTGREWDATVGLYHFRARWMSPKTGRFLGRDPIGYEGSEWGLYEFLESSSVSQLDSLGTSCESARDAALELCNARNIICNRNCVASAPPWFVRPKGSWAHRNWCEGLCQGSYMSCYSLVEASYAACVAERNKGIICGTCLIGIGGVICCLDTPLPGPADCLGAPIAACGAALCTVDEDSNGR